MKGSAVSTLCPKRGFALMRDTVGKWIGVPVTCNNWGCAGCRQRNRARIAEMVQYSTTIVGPLYFISVTYEAVRRATPDAKVVMVNWRNLLKRLKRNNPERYQKMAWFRVIELTKAGVPHLHLLVGNLGLIPLVDCRPKHLRKKYNRRDIENGCVRGCLTHEWCSEWLGVTSDSFVCFAEAVYSPGGAGYYLTKYMLKSFEEREAYAVLGFTRRYDTSQNWPRPKVSYVGTALKLWTATRFINQQGIWALSKDVQDNYVRRAETHHLTRRVGKRSAVDFVNGKRNARLARKLKGRLQNEDNKEIDSGRNGSG